MRGRITAAAVGAVVLVGAGMGTAPQAHAADGTCVITGVTPKTVNIGLSTVEKGFTIKTTGCKVSYWEIDLDGETVMKQGWYDGLSFTRKSLTNASAGWYQITAYVENADGKPTERTFDEGLQLTRRTGWESLNASPEPVRKGSSITIKGKLVRANWSTETYQGYGGRSVRVEFKPAGSSTWTYVKQATTSSTGWVSTKVTASKDGSWRLRYNGNTISGASTSSSDYVDVK